MKLADNPKILTCANPVVSIRQSQRFSMAQKRERSNFLYLEACMQRKEFPVHKFTQNRQITSYQ